MISPFLWCPPMVIPSKGPFDHDPCVLRKRNHLIQIRTKKMHVSNIKQAETNIATGDQTSSACTMEQGKQPSREVGLDVHASIASGKEPKPTLLLELASSWVDNFAANNATNKHSCQKRRHHSSLYFSPPKLGTCDPNVRPPFATSLGSAPAAPKWQPEGCSSAPE